MVVCGDLINKAHADQAQTAEYLRIVGKLAPSIKIYNVAGNHDVFQRADLADSLAAYRRGSSDLIITASGMRILPAW